MAAGESVVNKEAHFRLKYYSFEKIYVYKPAGFFLRPGGMLHRKNVLTIFKSGKFDTEYLMSESAMVNDKFIKVK